MSTSRSSGHRFRRLVSLLAGATLVTALAGFTGIGSTTVSGSPQAAVVTPQAAVTASHHEATATPHQAAQKPATSAADTVIRSAQLSSAVEETVLQKPTSVHFVNAAATCGLPVYDGAGIAVKSGPRLAAFDSHLFFGSYSQCKNGVVTTGWYCVQAGKFLYLWQSYAGVLTITGMSTTVSQEVAYVLQRWGNTGSNYQAAAVSASIRRLINDPRVAPKTTPNDWTTVYAKELPASVVSLSNTMVSEAKLYHGNHKLNLSGVPTTAHVGQVVTATVSVTSTATGKAIPNATLATSYTGFKAISVPKTTGSTGKTTIKLQVTSLSGASLSVSNTSLQSVRLLQTIPSSTQQRLVKAYTTANVKVSASAHLTVVKPAAPSVTQTCTTTCAGVAPVTIKPACNASGAAAKQTVIWVNGTVKATITLTSGACGSKTLSVADRGRVCSADRYYLNGVYTAYVTTTSCVTVDCPPLPGIHIHWTQQADVDCPCNGGAKVTVAASAVTITATRNTSHANQYLIVNGQVVQTWAPGQTPAPYVLNVPASTKLTVQSGTYRLNGSQKTQTNLSSTSLLDLLQQ